MSCMLDFGEGLEASISRKAAPRSPYRFPVSDEATLESLMKMLHTANPECECTADGRVLSVTLPPSINVGDQPVDLRKLAFVLRAARTIGELGLEGEMETCCGDGSNSCCAN